MRSTIVFTSRTIVMQRLIDSINHGYSNWCTGSISVDRCSKMVKKFDLNYQALADRNERARRKRAGLGNSALVLWQSNGLIRWWLLVTPLQAGNHAAHACEKLLDAHKPNGRIEIEDFELVRLPQKAYKRAGSTNNGQLANKTKTQNTKLTWRMNEYKYSSWRASIIESVRNSGAHSLELLIYRLWSAPGFSAIRSQIGKLAALYRAEVKRSGRMDAPTLPKRLGYIRRLRNQGITLAELVAQAQRPLPQSREEGQPADGSTSLTSTNRLL